MVVNQETAMRLWNNQFGKVTRVTDFADREIDKGAYNDRNSEYGWNVDHILPESRGGKTTDSNLICCHIKTNDEKADKFPCFVANGIRFEIVKVQNHYEIKRIDEESKVENKQEQKCINFMDSAAGVSLLKKFEEKINEDIFIAVVTVKFRTEKKFNKAPIFEFVKELLGEGWSFEYETNTMPYLYSYGSTNSIDSKIIAVQYDVKTKEQTANILQKCVVLNTYFSKYFQRSGKVEKYTIYYREDCYNRYSKNIEKELNDNKIRDISLAFEGSLLINDAIIEFNETVKQRLGKPQRKGYYEYDYIYTTLGNNLLKEANSKE